MPRAGKPSSYLRIVVGVLIVRTGGGATMIWHERGGGSFDPLVDDAPPESSVVPPSAESKVRGQGFGMSRSQASGKLLPS